MSRALLLMMHQNAILAHLILKSHQWVNIIESTMLIQHYITMVYHTILEHDTVTERVSILINLAMSWSKNRAGNRVIEPNSLFSTPEPFFGHTFCLKKVHSTRNPFVTKKKFCTACAIRAFEGVRRGPKRVSDEHSKCGASGSKKRPKSIRWAS